MEYSLVRKKRKTLSIVIKEGKVTVLAPSKVSLAFIEDFLNKKQDWIEKKLALFEQANNKFYDFISYKCVSIFGRSYAVTPDKAVKNFKLSEGLLLVPFELYKDYESLQANNKFVLRLKQFLKRIAKNELKSRLEELALQHGFEFSSFSLSDAKSKWGSCDSKKKILLNTRLIMLEKKLIDYVILHELCHTRVCNHSKDFWKEVEKYCPDYKNERKCLKECSILINTMRN